MTDIRRIGAFKFWDLVEDVGPVNRVASFDNGTLGIATIKQVLGTAFRYNYPDSVLVELEAAEIAYDGSAPSTLPGQQFPFLGS